MKNRIHTRKLSPVKLLFASYMYYIDSINLIVNNQSKFLQVDCLNGFEKCDLKDLFLLYKKSSNCHICSI